MASLFVVSLMDACHFYCQAVENVFADDKVFVHYIKNCVARQQHVYLLLDVKMRYFSLDGDLSLLTLNFLHIIAIGTTLFQYQTAFEKITLPVCRSTFTSCILKGGRAIRGKFGPLWSQKLKVAFFQFHPIGLLVEWSKCKILAFI